jgi:hypothetical protein
MMIMYQLLRRGYDAGKRLPVEQRDKIAASMRARWAERRRAAAKLELNTRGVAGEGKGSGLRVSTLVLYGEITK